MHSPCLGADPQVLVCESSRKDSTVPSCVSTQFLRRVRLITRVSCLWQAARAILEAGTVVAEQRAVFEKSAPEHRSAEEENEHVAA